MAPFAFLGPAYDGALREFYTTTSTRDIFVVGSFLNMAARALLSEAIADTSPLVALIERHLMGGDCLNVGCVPSKGMIRAANAWAPCFRRRQSRDLTGN